MKQYRVTINLSVNINDWDDHHMYNNKRDEKQVTKARKVAFARTETYYQEHDLIQYIKASNSAMDMVEYMFCNSEVKSAEWDAQKFAIHMVVESEELPEEIREDLEMNSLEDGEYETCGESGWVIFTRGPNGEINYGGMDLDLKNFWEYALVDYRENPIVIEEITKE